jgi:putative ABC transport system permease protein
VNGLLFILRQMRYKKARTAWTVVAVALVTFCFLLLQTVSWAWRTSMEARRDDRIAIWNRSTYALTLPHSYAAKVATVDGILKTSYASYLRGFDPNSRSNNYSLTTLAVDENYFDVYPETEITPAELDNWKKNRHGAVLSKKLSDLFHYKVGDKVTIEGLNIPGVWHFEICGIYTSHYRTFADNLFLFHWEYLTDVLDKNDIRRGEINWVMARVDRSRSLEITKDVERRFAAEPIQTQSMTERNMIGQLMTSFHGILGALNLIGCILVGTMALILVNVLTMRLRERKFEFGILRALGYQKRQIVALTLGESCVIGLSGGVAGVVLSKWLIDHAIGSQIEQTMGSLFPYFSVPPWSLVFALVLPAALAVAGSALQAIRASEQGIASLLKDIE